MCKACLSRPGSGPGTVGRGKKRGFSLRCPYRDGRIRMDLYQLRTEVDWIIFLIMIQYGLTKRSEKETSI
jgi:hypothetical protein